MNEVLVFPVGQGVIVHEIGVCLHTGWFFFLFRTGELQEKVAKLHLPANPRTDGVPLGIPGSGDVPRWRAQCWFPHGVRNVRDFDLNRTVTMRSLAVSLVNLRAVLGLPSHHGGHRLQHQVLEDREAGSRSFSYLLQLDMSDHGQTTEVTCEGVVTYPYDEGTTDGGAFDGNTIFSVACPNADSFPYFNMFRVRASGSFFRCCRERCFLCLQSCGCCLLCLTVRRSSTARASSTGAALVVFREGQSSRLVCLLFTRHGNVSLCIWKCAIVKFRWW